MSEKQEEKIIKEYAVSIGETPSVGVFRVSRAFYLKTVNGPPVEIKPGQLIELGKETHETLFCIGKISPLEIPEKYKVRVPFRTTINGLFVDLRVDDVIELDTEEALKLWRQNYVTPVREEV
jgi:hypothetical protein